MKKTLILGFAAAGFTLGSMTASATSDSQYPASNFQPKVIFADKELTQPAATTRKPAPKAEFDPKYPATNFEPKVVYADPELISQAKTVAKKPARTVEFDPKYPAANFQPKVIYP